MAKDVDELNLELTMLLLYINRFHEGNVDGRPVYRAWKGYDFSILDELDERELIFQGRNPTRTKGVTLSDEGIAYAESILEKYGLLEPEGP